MPSYNSSKYIKETIGSVILQTYKNWELIIVDDCSTDNSVDVIKQFDDDRIIVVENECNSGAAKSRNNAIKKAKGNWIAFLDSDDLWMCDKLEKQLSFMSNNSVVFSCTDYKVISEDGKECSKFSPKKEEYTYKDILKHCYVGCSTVIYNVDKLGKVYMPLAEKREDLACWLTILRSGEKVYYLHEFLAKYRLHSRSVSAKKTKMIRYQWNVYRKFEKLSIIKSIYYMIHWAIKGFLKYR